MSLAGRARTLDGLGGIHELDSYLDGVASIDALANSLVQRLNLQGFPGRFDVVPQMQALRRLDLPPTLTSERAFALQACVQIRWLEMQGFSGSLAFLQGWEALSTPDLRNSRQLSDIDVLLAPPNLQTIRLKGAEMKREQWPKALQERLTYRD